MTRHVREDRSVNEFSLPAPTRSFRWHVEAVAIRCELTREQRPIETEIFQVIAVYAVLVLVILRPPAIHLALGVGAERETDVVVDAPHLLERVGDEAGRIAKMAIGIADLEQPVDQYSAIREMAELVQTMLADSLDAFARLSAESAVSVIESDEVVDRSYDTIVREMGAEMKIQPEQVDRSLTVLWVARALERCGDHAKNLSEHVVYLVKGQDVRHSDAAAIIADH